MKRKIEKYGFARRVIERVNPIIEIVEQGDAEEAGRRIAKLVLEITDELEQGLISPKEGDDHFTLVDLYIDDHHPKLELQKEVRDLLFEGNILHDLGTEYGPSIEFMRELAEKILREDSRRK